MPLGYGLKTYVSDDIVCRVFHSDVGKATIRITDSLHLLVELDAVLLRNVKRKADKARRSPTWNMPNGEVTHQLWTARTVDC